MRRALKAFGVGAAFVMVGIFAITLIAVLAPLIFLAVVSYDVVDDVRQAWRSRARAKARNTKEWAALKQMFATAPPPARMTMEELAALQRLVNAKRAERVRAREATGGVIQRGRLAVDQAGEPELVTPTKAWTDTLVANLHRLVVPKRGTWNTH